ncbi:40S ribosomal protein S20-like [Culex pipiens pallens]|uniref:40S ribosomal protein S20-like n=1 Tax=Culex pipiens pallens TaxID=42434 RepID=UPI001952F340|nr:40S ribosomal protein S20-like [Culex pipiens pallens]
MAATRKDIEKAATLHRNRVTLTLRNVRSLEKVCADLISGAKKQKLHVKGSVRMPTKILRITTRLAVMHKRIIDLHSPFEIVKQITSINIKPGVEVKVTIADP